jgi:hypothetical protein
LSNKFFESSGKRLDKADRWFEEVLERIPLTDLEREECFIGVEI